VINKASAIKSLRPNVEWSMSGDDVENIIWHTEGVEPLTEKEVQDEIIRLEQAQENEQVVKATQKAAILERLGLTEDELRVVLS
jgi:hypothetical protein